MTLTHQRVLRDRLLLVLEELGGRAGRQDALAALDRRYDQLWTAEDVEKRPSRPAEFKWQNNTSYERANMVRAGLLEQRNDGIWALTSAGRQQAAVLGGTALGTPEPDGASGMLDVDLLHRLQRKIPHGRWTTYGDLNVIAGTGTTRGGRGVATHMKTCRSCHAEWLVMRANGIVPSFTWLEGHDLGDPATLRREAGLRFTNGHGDEGDVADPDQHIAHDELLMALGSDLDSTASRKVLRANPTDIATTATQRAEQSLLRGHLLRGRTAAECDLCDRRLPASLLVAAHIVPRRHLTEEER